MASYLQGAFRAPADATIRVTVAPSGTADWVVTEGDYWVSMDAMLAEFRAAIPVATSIWDINLVSDTDAHTSTLQVVSTRAWTITWSHAGDGTAIRNWFGASGNLNETAGTYNFAAPHTAGWYPKYGFTAVRRDTQRRHRSHVLLQSGASQAQHNTSPSDLTGASVRLGVQLHDGTGSYEGHEQLEQFVEDIHTATGAVPVFSAFWGVTGSESSEVLRFVGEDLEIMPRQVASSSPGELWRVEIDCEVAA